MKPLLLLVDLQNDYLSAPGLEPAAGEIVDAAARLLAGARSRGIAVAHVVTSVNPGRDDRMPHWKTQGRWMCVSGTPGHDSPAPLAPVSGEPVVHKTEFSAFSSPELDCVIASGAYDTVILAGIHLHGCVRATALDAYARRLQVWIAEDAVASNDRLHSAATLRYLEGRAARFWPIDAIWSQLSGGSDGGGQEGEERLPAAVVAGRAIGNGHEPAFVHVSPRRRGQRLFSVPLTGASVADDAAAAARAAQRAWAGEPVSRRSEVLLRIAEALERDALAFGERMACEIGKPLAMGEAETRRAADLARVAAAQIEAEPRRCGRDSMARRRPVGVVAAVTPWNNPVAIALGKIAPALLFGNAVVWKPAPAATRIALQLFRLFEEAGLPDGVLNLVAGGRAAARAVFASTDVSAASFSGSSRAGYAAQEICSSRRIPLQAELGGNNAAIVWEGADPIAAAGLVAHGAFAFAGQRCTANRRAVVSARLYDRFLSEVTRAAGQLRWGDPALADTQAGPLISEESRRRVAGAVSRAPSSARVVTCGEAFDLRSLSEEGSYHAPVVIAGPDPSSEIVQEETFGPVLVVQKAEDFDGALGLVNGVSQGLVASLIGGSPAQRRAFLDNAEAGIVKFDQSTADADASAPFGGWKGSGVGPPEHGEADREFFTREQAVYGSA